MPFLKRPVGGGIILGVMLLGSAQVSAQTSPAWNQKLVQDKLEKMDQKLDDILGRLSSIEDKQVELEKLVTSENLKTRKWVSQR